MSRGTNADIADMPGILPCEILSPNSDFNHLIVIVILRQDSQETIKFLLPTLHPQVNHPSHPSLIAPAGNKRVYVSFSQPSRRY